MALTADVDRRVWPLNRLGPGEDRVEIDEAAVELSLVLGPELFERGQLLVQLVPASRRSGAVVAHFVAVPAHAHTHVEATSGNQVDAGDLLGGVDHVTLWQQDPSGQPKAAGDSVRGGQCYERVQCAVIFARHLPAPRNRLLRRDRNVRCSVTQRELNPRCSTAAASAPAPMPSSVRTPKYR